MTTLQEAAKRAIGHLTDRQRSLSSDSNTRLHAKKVIDDLRTALAQQGEQPTQRQLDTAMRQWGTWKAYALELQAKVVKYEGGSPMLLNAAAPAPVAQQSWTTATQVLEARAEADKRLNSRLREAMDAMPIAAIREVK